ncbi:MAG: UDP-N-acetylmuramate--L-alanine ligase [Candidatus Sumerlaeia bacterium]|nr:UDP-N-acetylmuramate--L-alanine ligase [Candidatus Sumerlaeia bacterium]
MHLSGVKRAHFIAIGGSGMSGIAWVMLHRGIEVSGSDLVGNSMTARLAERGARCFIGHRPENLTDADLVVVSTAIREDNCELVEARRRGLPVWHRSQALGALMREGCSLGVAGSHGKTTTTCMLGLICERAECDPTVIVGGESANFGGTARAGRSDYIVAEIDESDGSFLDLQPDHAVITNIEADHLDHYGNYEAIVEAFRQFASQVGQPPVVCADDPGIQRVIATLNRPVVRYGLSAADAEYRATDLVLSTYGSRFTVLHNGRQLGHVSLNAPGVHNIYNALGAIALAVQAGLAPRTCCQALADYCGVGRRLTIRAEARGILIVDDYAHHPTEINATLKVGRAWANDKKGRLIAVFQPHRYTRTAALGREFGPAFSAADEVVITGIYAAGERPIEGVTGELIADSVKSAGHVRVRYVAEPAQIASLLEGELASGDVVITLGAGNVWQVGDALRKRLEQRAA